MLNIRCYYCLSLLLLLFSPLKADDDANEVGNFKNPQAVKEVLAGSRKTANAAWWGFDKTDSTNALQSAINSGATKVIVPYMGNDWIVRPITLTSNQEIYFEPGVVIIAKKGEFRKTGDCLISAMGKKNIILSGYGATLKMRKKDYMSESYAESQWRMAVSLIGCENVQIKGLTIKESGGDGLYISQGEFGVSREILVEDCIFDNNYRQGISVISVENLRINNCVFENTSGTNPSAGIDLEPNRSIEKLSNIVISNCIFRNNDGPAFVVSPVNLTSLSKQISVMFYNCLIDGDGYGVVINSVKGGEVGGIIEFNGCTIENTKSYGIFMDSDVRSYDVIFKNCKLNNCALESIAKGDKNVPVYIRFKKPKDETKTRYIVFDNVAVYDLLDRQKLLIYCWPGVSFRKDDKIYGTFIYNDNRNGKYLGNTKTNLVFKKNEF